MPFGFRNSDNTLKSRIRLAGSFLSLAAILVAVIMAAGYVLNRSYGWFASGSNAAASGMNASAKDEAFEIAVVADPNQRTSFVYEESGSGILNFLGEPENGGFRKINETGGSGAALFCRLANEKTGSDDDSLNPGDFGKISFDIILTGGDFSAFSINIATTGVKRDDEVSGYRLALLDESQDRAAKYIKGHILFFSDRVAISGTDEYYYSGLLEDGSLVYDLSQNSPVYVDGDTRPHYRVTVYWIWPSTFAQIAFSEGDVRLHSHSLFGSTSAQAEQRAVLLDYIEEHSSNANNGEDNYFFYDCAYEFVRGAGMENTYYVAFSDGYNNADQIIGDSVNYLVAEANVTPASVNSGD